MTRRDLDRLEDVLAAIDAIRGYLVDGSLSEGVVFDAVLYRLMQIGEAVKAVPLDLLQQESQVDRAAAARLRDRLAHRCWDTVHAVVEHLVEHDLEPMALVTERLRQSVDRDGRRG